MAAEPNLSVVTRCDGSARIGSGHVTRCRALGHALRARGVTPTFAMRTLSGGAVNAVRTAGFGVVPLDLPDPETLEADDALLTAEAARQSGATVVVVDHYGADSAYFDALADAGLTVAVIDDRADRDLSRAAWLLNQNLAAPGFDYDLRASATRLLGVDYALLRPEFARARAGHERHFSAADAHVLVTFGGGDTTGVAALTLRALDEVARALVVTVVVGTAAGETTELDAAVVASRQDVRLLRGVADMSKLMTAADLSINAGGSTCWELMCLGVPMLVTGLSSDQHVNQAPLSAAGVAVHVPSAELDRVGPLVEALLADADRRREMSARASELVDGRGAERAAASLAELVAATQETERAAG